jgi:CRP/FNR family transcriptional regulator, cyclic AMP receptor protein
MSVPMSHTVIKEWLRAVPLFSELSDAELAMVASASRSQTSRKGACTFEEGASADCCYVLTAGKAKLVLSAEGGAEIILGVVTPKGIVGEVALLDDSTRSADLIAIEECHFRIPKSSFDALRRNPKFEQRVVAHVVSLLRDANDQVRITACLPSISKVAWGLARIARWEGTRRGAFVIIPKRPHHELAEMTGCSRETVTRALAGLKRKKWVTWNDDIMTLDVEGLQRILRRDLRLDAAVQP